MKTKPGKKKGAKPSKGRKSIKDDPFFSHKLKRRRLEEEDSDGEDYSDDDDDDDVLGGGESEGNGDVRENGGEAEEETADERRQRVARVYLEKILEIGKWEEEEEEEEEDDGEGEREGRRGGGDRDELVAKILQKEQLEDSGRVRRHIASSHICF